MILAGGYRNGNIRVDTGDWVIGAPGTEELSRAEDEECWCLSRIEPPGVRFAGWRRWIAPFFSRRSSAPFPAQHPRWPHVAPDRVR